MPRMSMVIHNNNLPRVPVMPQASYNAQINQGSGSGSGSRSTVPANKNGALMNMAFKAPMVDRIAGLKPGCGACGKK